MCGHKSRVALAVSERGLNPTAPQGVLIFFVPKFLTKFPSISKAHPLPVTSGQSFLLWLASSQMDGGSVCGQCFLKSSLIF